MKEKSVETAREKERWKEVVIHVNVDETKGENDTPLKTNQTKGESIGG